MPLRGYVGLFSEVLLSEAGLKLTILDEEIKLQRGGEKGTSPRFRCKDAEQSVEQNLQKFRDMRDGKYRPREAFLRMKQDVRFSA